MKVVAIKMGFFLARRRIGDEFEFPDGRALPSWVKPVSKEARKLASEAKTQDEEKFVEGARASAGNAKAVSQVGARPGASELV